MAVGGSKLLFFLSLLAILLCCFTFQVSDDWTINMRSTPSSTSRYFILNDWQNTYSQDPDTASFPAVKVSDLMLKTMGILKEGANWPGIVMGNLFNRPLATALFMVNGISPESSLGKLAQTSFAVDQGGLTGCTCGDSSVMFRADNVAQHLDDLFDENSQMGSVSANVMAAQKASANGAHTTQEEIDSLMADIQKGKLDLGNYGLEEAARRLDMYNEVDALFFTELVLIKDEIEQLKELTGYARDTSPDVFIFTISSLEKMEDRYGKGSSKMAVASELVKRVIQESTAALVELYDGRVLVQALVLEWEQPEMDKSSPTIASAYSLLQPYLANEDRESFLSALPRVVVKPQYVKDTFLCTELRNKLKDTSFYAHCPQAPPPPESRVLRDTKSWGRRKRQAEEDDLNADLNANNSNVTNPFNMTVTVTSVADSRSNLFSGIFLISLFLTVSLGLALYAVSWAIWHLDPGRDSVIYRQVADPTIQMNTR